MEKIRIVEDIKIDDEYYYLVFKFTMPIPVVFLPFPNKMSILKSWQIKYSALTGIEDNNVVFTDKMRLAYSLSVEDVKSALIAKYNKFESILNAIEVTTPDQINGLTFNGTSWE